MNCNSIVIQIYKHENTTRVNVTSDKAAPTQLPFKLTQGIWKVKHGFRK